MPLHLNDVGAVIRVGAGFDMSGNTGLELTFTSPAAVVTTVTKAANGVTAPAVPASGFFPDGTPYSFAANEYWEYETEAGLLDELGPWQLYGRYIDADPTSICGDGAAFAVIPCGG